MKKILYLGLDPTRFVFKGELFHHPIITICERNAEGRDIKEAFDGFDSYTHVIFTSRIAVTVFQKYKKSLLGKKVIAIGSATAEHLSHVDAIAKETTQEGIIALLDSLSLQDANVFIPCSALAREEISDYLKEKKVRFRKVALYDTLPSLLPLPLIDPFDEIVFTSPSTVHAFFAHLKRFPKEKKLTCIGPITQKTLDKYRDFSIVKGILIVRKMYDEEI